MRHIHIVGRLGSSFVWSIRRRLSTRDRQSQIMYLEDGHVEVLSSPPLLNDGRIIPSLHSRCGQSAEWGHWATRSIDYHTDNTGYRYTMGVVLSGNHLLLARKGEKRRLRLALGSVYLLDSRRFHAARRLVRSSSTVLEFVCIDFNARSMLEAKRVSEKWLKEALLRC